MMKNTMIKLTVACVLAATPAAVWPGALEDLDLEAMEAQIKQLEEEEKQQKAVEAKRKAEQEAQRPSRPHALAGEMVKIPGGTFQMGSNDGDDDERPVHRVSIPAFEMGKYEVTQQQWREVMGSNPSVIKNCDTCPVENVSWDDVQAFLKALNQKIGGNYRLPSEAEWEYACRGGGRQQKYCGGNNNPESLAWYDANSGYKTHPVGQKQPNALGLYDMSGNLREWVEDCWNGSYSGAPADGSAWTRGDCHSRVNRGGSWYNHPVRLRSANRFRHKPDNRDDLQGFRLAQDL